MISTEYRCIHVHIPKTAGTSIEASLGWYKQTSDRAQCHRPITQLRETLTPEEFRNYFKFAIVRNPWDRVVSWYKNVLAHAAHREKFGIAETCTLYEFLTEHQRNWALKPQLHWIRDSNGTIPLDYIGRFEHLQEDFARICERMGARAVRLSARLVRSADRRPYTSFYDFETRSIVAKRYAEEIELFGYICGGCRYPGLRFSRPYSRPKAHGHYRQRQRRTPSPIEERAVGADLATEQEKRVLPLIT